MALSQSLQQKLLQRLSPQQIQLMKLLQVPTASLEVRIKEEMEENPALELDEDKHEDTDEMKDEFSEPGEEEFEEKDGSNDEYDNIDVSEYVREGDDEVGDYKLRDDNYPEEDDGRHSVERPRQRQHDLRLAHRLGTRRGRYRGEAREVGR